MPHRAPPPGRRRRIVRRSPHEGTPGNFWRRTPPSRPRRSSRMWGRGSVSALRRPTYLTSVLQVPGGRECPGGERLRQRSRASRRERERPGRHRLPAKDLRRRSHTSSGHWRGRAPLLGLRAPTQGGLPGVRDEARSLKDAAPRRFNMSKRPCYGDAWCTPGGLEAEACTRENWKRAWVFRQTVQANRHGFQVATGPEFALGASSMAAPVRRARQRGGPVMRRAAKRLARLLPSRIRR